MTGATAAALAAPALLAAAVLVWPSRRERSRRRLTLLGRGTDPVPAPPREAAGRSGRLFGACAAGAAVVLFAGLPWGVPLGTLTAVAGYLALGRLEPARVRRQRERLAADLPIAVDLLAACLVSGAAPSAAADAVSRAVGGPVAEALDGVVSLLRLGGDPIESWAVLDRDPVLAPLGRAIGRAMSSGAPVAAALEHVAVDARRQRHAEAEEAARKVGVKAAAPLGLCFLPAFVLLGVVPVAGGIASTLDLW